jgi:hypothetical protein
LRLRLRGVRLPDVRRMLEFTSMLSFGKLLETVGFARVA